MFSNRFLKVEYSHNLASHLLVSLKYCHPEPPLLFLFLLINLKLHTLPISRVRSGTIIHCAPSEIYLEIHRLLQVTEVPGRAMTQSSRWWLMSRVDV